MPQWHRVFQPGGTYAFTLVTAGRAPILTTSRARVILRRQIQACRAQWPFEIIAIVLMPDHLHTLWRLPPDDAAYPARIGWIKKEFTKAWLAEGGPERSRTAAAIKDRRRGVFQRRYWEHAIRSQTDLEHHLAYIHYNPVKHGLVHNATDWPWSSLHRYMSAGIYPPDWGRSEPDFTPIPHDFGEP
jgi:putative transposase